MSSDNQPPREGGAVTEREAASPPSQTDLRFVERQIIVHVDLTQWKPDGHVQASRPECWRRAFAIAHLRREGVTDISELASRLDASEEEIEEDRRLVPYLDRTVAGLLSVLGWYVDSQI